MNADAKHTEVINNENDQQYEVHMGDQVAVLKYNRAGKHITYIHTGVPQAMEGHGIASKLAHTALEDARTAHSHTSVPVCCIVYPRTHRVSPIAEPGGANAHNARVRSVP